MSDTTPDQVNISIVPIGGLIGIVARRMSLPPTLRYMSHHPLRCISRRPLRHIHHRISRLIRLIKSYGKLSQFFGDEFGIYCTGVAGLDGIEGKLVDATFVFGVPVNSEEEALEAPCGATKCKKRCFFGRFFCPFCAFCAFSWQSQSVQSV